MTASFFVNGSRHIADPRTGQPWGSQAMADRYKEQIEAADPVERADMPKLIANATTS